MKLIFLVFCVQILEVDFSTKQVRLDQFVQLAQTMQLHLSAPIRSKSTVKQKMTLVTQTWQDLQNRYAELLIKLNFSCWSSKMLKVKLKTNWSQALLEPF